MAAGGKRKGAGRPAPNGARVNLTTRIAPETKRKIEDLKESGFKIGEFIDQQIDILYANRKKIVSL